MAAPLWEPGTLYQPGALVRPISAPSISATAPENPNFELGDSGWTSSHASIAIENNPAPVPGGAVFDGTHAMIWASSLYGSHYFTNDRIVPVAVGQSITASCRHRRGTDNTGRQGSAIGIQWLDSDYVVVGETMGTQRISGTNGPWYQLSVTATAPSGAVFAQIIVRGFNNNDGGTHTLRWDAFTWNYTFQGVPEGLVFRAVQASAGYSATTEPTWPTVAGQQVTDNEVTWEAAFATRVTWQATPILKSGSTEPNFPESVGGTVEDGTIAWQAMDHRVTDVKCPNSKVVAIGASKIFAADDDIITFSATVNPLDWSTANDAGYLPFGLQTYGATPCTALGLYRGNLVAFNSEGYQMWQVDEDPANMALLDASPVDCTYPKSVQPVSNDLVLLSSQGVRSIGIAGASTNLQAGFFGKQIDPLVLQAIRELGTTETAADEPRGLFWPGAGQYWLIFGTEVFVLTMNGGSKDMAWSRYVFPDVITGWAILDGELYLRAGEVVWQVSDTATQDDVQCVNPEMTASLTVGTGTVDAQEAKGYLAGDFGALDESDVSPTFTALFSVDSNELHFSVQGSSSAPAADFFDGRTLTVFNSVGGEIATGDFTGATSSVDGTTRTWQVDISQNNLFAEYGGQEVSLEISSGGEGSECSGTSFSGYIAWPYLDFGQLGVEKQLEGFDLVCEGTVQVSIGYSQRDTTLATDAYELDGDTLPGNMIPMPMSAPSFQMRLTFPGDQQWEWMASALYLTDQARTP